MTFRALESHRWALATFLVALAAACSPSRPPQVSIPIAPPPAAPPPASQDARFTAFLRDFRAQALAAGVRPETYNACMAGAVSIPQVEELNRQQPEFVKPVWAYLDTAVSPTRIENGQAMLARYADTLNTLESRYGVRKEILVAIWGLESAYGTTMGSFNMFSALATLAYDGPRQDFARRELIAAMKLVDREHLNPHTLTSSWAGAIGQMQFEPSSYLAHAVDGDGDGRIDMWRSPADALASAAVLLRTGGWRTGEPCYREIALPSAFPYEQADAETMQPMSRWRALGVRAVRGSELADSDGPASIYLPAGWRGPAFMVFANFKAVLTYNNAASYALAVCNLADRLRGGGEILASWPRGERPLSPSERMAMQSDLKALGYDPGPADGVLGRKARAALRLYQKDHHIPADGYPTVEMLSRLSADLKARAS
ncbi:MAG: lytic murein transglycosylase [Alphaproteobacteria bacterium]|nr:lytic murein transglycosylase [Alphaproteobacteria bacterium]